MSKKEMLKNKELEVAKKIIINHLSQAYTKDALYSMYKISNGNKKELLAHINAIITIFTIAKEQLEEKIKIGDYVEKVKEEK